VEGSGELAAPFQRRSLTPSGVESTKRVSQTNRAGRDPQIPALQDARLVPDLERSRSHFRALKGFQGQIVGLRATDNRSH